MTKYRYARRKYRSGGEGAHHDRWVISYADFIILLFAFFVVLFASAYRDSQAVRRVSSAIHKGFQEMGPFAEMQAGARDGRTQEPATGPATISVVDIAKLRQQLEAAIGPEIRNHEVELRVTSEGFVISLREMGFFASGRADLLLGAAAKIQRNGTVLLQHGLEIRGGIPTTSRSTTLNSVPTGNCQRRAPSQCSCSWSIKPSWIRPGYPLQVMRCTGPSPAMQRQKADAFCGVEPKAGRHFTKVTPNRSAPKFAAYLLEIVAAYPENRYLSSGDG